MLKQEEVDAEEERLREIISALPDDLRKKVYKDIKRELRDPDTYAALNWFFLAGLHHFYLGRWLNGVLNLAIFLIGVGLIFAQRYWPGITLILLVSIWEMWALFRSQIIVQDVNNKVCRVVLGKYGY